MLRCTVAVALALTLGAAEDLDADRLLVAARAANQSYQNRLAVMSAGLADEAPAQRLESLRQLAQLHDPDTAPLLLPALEAATRTPEELQAACIASEAVGNPGVTGPALRTLLMHPDPEVRLAAYNATERLKITTNPDHLQRGRDDQAALRGASLTNLGTIKVQEAAPLLLQGLIRHRDPHIRRMCAIGLGKLGDRSVGPQLKEALSDPDPEVRARVSEALVRIDYKAAIPNLIFALESNVAAVQINRSLVRLAGKDFGFDPWADALKRQVAIDRAFAWWSVNHKKLGVD
jgi:hypothetical protein